MATIQDSIDAKIKQCERGISPLHSSIFNRNLETKIRILKTSPQNSVEIEKIIVKKKAALDAPSTTLEKADLLRMEIYVLEWLFMILAGSQRKIDNWALG
jgi:hypothetical protein